MLCSLVLFRGHVFPAATKTVARDEYSASKREVQGGCYGCAEAWKAGTRLAHRTPHHGVAGLARPPLGAAHHLGTARGNARLPRTAGALRYHVAQRAEPTPARAAGGGYCAAG